MNHEPPNPHFGLENPSSDDVPTPSPDAANDHQSVMPTAPRIAVNPLTAAQVDAIFADIATALRGSDAESFPPPTPIKSRQPVPVDAPLNLVVDLALGIVSDPALALCQMCLTGLVEVRTRRVCAHCVRVDRLLAGHFDAARFLPTTRRTGQYDRCHMVRTQMPRTSMDAGSKKMHRTVERELWHQMQRLFESNLSLLAQLRGISPTQPLSYTDWVTGYSPSITRSLDAYLSYAIVHAPWAREHIEQLIIDNEGRLA